MSQYVCTGKERFLNIPAKFQATGNVTRTTQLSGAEIQELRNKYVLDKSSYMNIIDSYEDFGDVDLAEIVKSIRTIAADCDENAMSISGQTMQDEFEEVAKQIEQYITQISGFADALRTRANDYITLQESVLASTQAYLNNRYEQHRKIVEQLKSQNVKPMPTTNNSSTIGLYNNGYYHGGSTITYGNSGQPHGGSGGGRHF